MRLSGFQALGLALIPGKEEALKELVKGGSEDVVRRAERIAEAIRVTRGGVYIGSAFTMISGIGFLFNRSPLPLAIAFGAASLLCAGSTMLMATELHRYISCAKRFL